MSITYYGELSATTETRLTDFNPDSELTQLTLGAVVGTSYRYARVQQINLSP